MEWKDTSSKYLIIGAGPTGLACSSVFLKKKIPFYGVEASHDVGGLWDITNPKSTMYQTAHLISSRTQTQFDEYPMNNSKADYPNHREVFNYLNSYADFLRLRDYFLFNTSVINAIPKEEKWQITLSTGDVFIFKGIVLCSGILSEPRMPLLKGEFRGELIHSAQYKDPTWFQGKKVLIVGGGNSACDIVVDATHHAKEVHWSLRRGYHFLPKFVLGKPIDLLSKAWLPKKVKQWISVLIAKFFIGDVTRFGLQKPDHKLYEVHPILNSLAIHHLGHGDITPHPDIDFAKENRVQFVDETVVELDAIVLCTGYRIYYPYIDKSYLNWDGQAPKLYLNIFHPKFNNLFVLGMVEAAGLGWQGKYDQAQLVASFIENQSNESKTLERFLKEKSVNLKDLSGGKNYMKLDRMAYYVHKETYRNEIKKWIKRFEKSIKK